LLFLSFRVDLFKKSLISLVSVVTDRIEVEFGRKVPEVNAHRLADPISGATAKFQDVIEDVMSHRKVLPTGE